MTPVLECDSVSVHFGGIRALDGLSLTVRSGERVAIVGANGSGKSTFINACSGVIAPTAGGVCIHGKRITVHEPEAFARAGVGRTFQNLRLMEELSVFDNVALGLTPRLRTVLGIPVASRRRVRADVSAACEEVGLNVPLWRAVSTISYGQRKRVELARMLIGQTRVMLLDEPMAGVSRVDTAVFADTLRSLSSPQRVLILVEHHLELVKAVADRVICIDHGRVIADGTFDAVFALPAVRASVLGESDRDQDAHR